MEERGLFGAVNSPSLFPTGNQCKENKEEMERAK
jgi:hypothetical protein